MADESEYKTESDSTSPSSSKAIASEPTSSSKAIASEPTSAEKPPSKATASEKKRPREISGSDASEVLILTCSCGKTKQHVPCTNVVKETFPPIWTCEECLKSLSNNEDSVEQSVSPTRSDASVQNQPSSATNFTSPSASPPTVPMDISPAKKQKLQD